MKNWKIGMRMGAGFGAVVLTAMALGIFAFVKILAIEKSAAEIVDYSLPKVFLVGQIEKNVHQVFSLVLEHVSTADKEKMAAIDVRIQSIRASNAQTVAQYEKLVNTDKGRELLQEFQAARTAFWTGLDETVQISRAGTPDAKRRAAELVSQRLQPLQEKYAEAAESVVEQNKTGADVAGKSIVDADSSAKTGVVVCLLIAVLIGVGISVVITRGITGPLW